MTPLGRQVALLLGTLSSVDDREIMLALRDLVMATERERLRLAREVLGIGVNELVACGYIAASGPHTPSEIADRLQITTASVTELVDRLERNGLVHRVRHPTDRRKLLVTLTELGEQRSELVQDAFARTMARSAAGLTGTERAAVLNFLRTATELIVRGDRENVPS
jgi:DNA-binding MarR family transcriptional regulator